MGYKRVPVDLNDLEVALTDRDGNSCFLDTDTGEIVVIAMWMESEEREAIAGRLEAAPHGRYLRIDPIEPGVDYRDMVAFADTVQDQALRRLLAVALDGRGAFRRFKAVLADFPAEREGWFQFVNSRSKARVLAWLGDNGLSPAGEE